MMYDFNKVEEEMTKLWDEQEIYKKAKDKVKNGKVFYFLDGPPYTSGKVHLGTAWNKSLKDAAIRYRRMCGYNVWDRAGYDMHGLPTAHKVEEKFGIKNKDQIAEFGHERYIKECQNLSVENMRMMNRDFKKLGVWMDFENAYQSIQPEFIEGVWWLIKKADEHKRLYESTLAMTWCKHCATALAKHELEYETVHDNSIFVKFQLSGKQDEFLIIWTTTPWTIPFNLGVMANPDLEYVKVEVDGIGEKWIVAKAMANTLITGVAGKKFRIVEEFLGDRLEGMHYVHPLYEDLKGVYEPIMKECKNAFSVVMSSEYVDTTAGSGLVHMAPGCGPEDFEIGHRNGIKAFNNISEFGVFPEEMGKLAGLEAKKDDKRFIEILEEKGAIVAQNPVEHEYAHCWRCKQPIVYRTTRQWFFRVEDLKDSMREQNQSITWVPDYAGSRQYDSWLSSLRDNCITRQRTWGTPFPVWRCEKCSEYIVIGSRDDIEKHGAKVPEDLHMPWIDSVTFSCKCGGTMRRIPDIMDVWIDAGSASWNCLYYPKRKELFESMFPADFILEGIDQVRGWFNMLYVASMVGLNKPSFKAVYMHGFINDALGRKMSKSLGNYITPEEVLPKYGVDALRYYMIGGTQPGLDLNYNFDDIKLRFKNLGVLWNLHELLLNSAKLAGKNPKEMSPKSFDIEERYMLSRMNSTIEEVTDHFENHRLSSVPDSVEQLFLSLSRDYVRLVRDKLTLGEDEDKERVLFTLNAVIMASLKCFAPIAPYITEAMYQNLKAGFGFSEESIHLTDWPKADKRMIDKRLEKNFVIVDGVTQKILNGRDKLGLGVRWPIAEAIIVTVDKDLSSAVTELSELIKLQTNIKTLSVVEKSNIKLDMKPDYGKVRAEYGPLTAKVIAHLAQVSPHSISNHIEKEGKYEFQIDGATLSLKKEQLVIEKLAPEGFQLVEMGKGDLLLSKTMTPELEAEGFSRELVRRVQEMRKEAGLSKSDRIAIHILADTAMVKSLRPFAGDIETRTGASEQVIADQPTSDERTIFKQFEIKGRKFEAKFDKA